MGKHYVPQEYLRAFSVPALPQHVWMFDKRSGRWTQPAIKRAAQERDYFAPHIETELAHTIEAPGHAALQVLRDGGRITPPARDALALYVAVMVMRVPRKRRKAREMIPGALSESIGNSRSEFEDLRSDENSTRIDELLQELERVERSYTERLPPTVTELVESPWPSAKVLTAVRQLTWRIIEAPDNQYFVTSDNPAHFFDDLGLGTDRAELSVPLSRRFALHGSWQGDRGGTWKARGTQELVAELNRRQCFGAERFIFSHRRAPWVRTQLSRVHLGFKGIDWSEPG